ncbi:major facilitator superfamily domain-containing protein [Kockovaella imperatae]|uniref:Major facilitator superfamily domain-containing protein n=1 Tax=Kockovaella imperatae TaxID=4999 RepID=A0A1Y1UKY3_9TREE|nr:major facilitator superfamily domain-containing protein [Kockovaella imperatae]ORX38164.1 major facilitator superfamily domain-containing protein [Kockovaella imperatae]
MDLRWKAMSEMTDVAVAALAAAYSPGSDDERNLVRKIDLRVIPCVWALYTLSYLDRANIGNAKTGGLEDDFGLTSDQYSVILLVFFISYVLFEVPSNLILTRVRPSVYLSALCVLWGGVAACMAAAKDWRQLAAIRFCLGIVEAGFSPGVAFYLSSWYRRYELSRRFSIYYTATAIAGAFSGLLAGLITQHLDGKRGIQGWQWLFIIEGVGSSFLGCFTWFIMPDYPSTTSWLTQEERLLAAQRLAFDGLANTQGTGERIESSKAVRLVLADWRTWIFVLMYMLSTGAQTIQYFVPTLVGSLGWTGYQGQYHTIPIYAGAFAFILIFSFLSDICRTKWIPTAVCGFGGCVFFILTVSVTTHLAQYVFLIFAVSFVYAVCPLILMWIPNVVTFPAEKRAVVIAFVNSLGNSASIYGVFLWPAKDSPRYVPGFAATTVWMFVLGCVAMVMQRLVLLYPLDRPDSTVPTTVTRTDVKGSIDERV